MVNIANGHETSAPVGRLATPERPVPGNSGFPVTLDAAFAVSGRAATAARYVLAGIRLALGWVFLWAFLDKLFGLGRSTANANAWLDGGSPTAGFLGKAATGPFTGFYHSIAGSVGLALLLGIGMRIAVGAGALLTVLMWTAVLPPETNPFMDDHLIYAAILIVLALLGAGNTWGFGRMWAATALVRRNTWLT
jgi:thiosulfate dehydrogenase (quinone) large subunit